MSETESRPSQSELVPPGGIECFDRDMTATISADVPLSTVQQTLASFNQWLPIDGDPHAAVGQLVESNSTGPLRLGYGAWRDLLLGIQFRNGRNDLITAGGRVVKNVAGYDLTKFMVGQRGIFGRVVTITTRTYRRPQASLVARFPSDLSIVAKLMPTPMRPQWMMIGPDGLSCGYHGEERALAYYERNLPALRPLDFKRRPLDEDVAERAAAWRTPVLRAALPPARIIEFIQQAAVRDWSADAAFGSVRIYDTIADASGLQDTALLVDGTAWRECGPLGVYRPTETRLLRQLKAAFDPGNTLEPLPL